MKRVYYTWDQWECYPAGFYDKRPRGGDMTDAECEAACRELLTSPAALDSALRRVFDEWPHSTEHYLTNERMNRVNWLQSAAACIVVGAPKRFRAGYHSLTEDQKDEADSVTLEALNDWMTDYGAAPLTLEEAGINQKVDLY